MHTNHRDDNRATRIFFIALASITLFRGVYNILFPLTGEEAYYWMWSRHLALCYFDHPPLIAWIIRLSTILLGHTVSAVRVPALVSHTCTAIVMFWCTWRITRDRITAVWAGVLFSVTPFFAAVATIAIPDSYLFLLWSLTIWLTLEATRKDSQKLWLAVGVTLGLSMLTKFHGILLALSIVFYLLMAKRQRHHLRSGWFYLGMLTAGLFTLPILIWNVQEGWPTLGYQLAGRHKYVFGNPTYFLEMLATPFAYIGPVLFPLTAAGVGWGFSKGIREKNDHLLFLSLAAVFPYLFFLVPSLFIKIDPQWAAPGFLAGTILAALFGVELYRGTLRPRWQKQLSSLALKVNVLLLAAVYGFGLLVLVMPNLVPRDHILLKYRSKRTATRKVGSIYGWQEIGERLQKEIALLGGPNNTFIYGRKGRCKTSALCFYAGGEAEAFVFDTPPREGHQFYIWEQKADLKGMNAVVVAKKKSYLDYDFLKAHFAKVEEAPDLVIKRGGVEQQHLYIVRAWNLLKKPNYPQ